MWNGNYCKIITSIPKMKKKIFKRNIQLFEPDEMTQAKIHILISYYGI